MLPAVGSGGGGGKRESSFCGLTMKRKKGGEGEWDGGREGELCSATAGLEKRNPKTQKNFFSSLRTMNNGIVNVLLLFLLQSHLIQESKAQNSPKSFCTRTATIKLLFLRLGDSLPDGMIWVHLGAR